MNVGHGVGRPDHAGERRGIRRLLQREVMTDLLQEVFVGVDDRRHLHAWLGARRDLPAILVESLEKNSHAPHPLPNTQSRPVTGACQGREWARGRVAPNWGSANMGSF